MRVTYSTFVKGLLLKGFHVKVFFEILRETVYLAEFDFMIVVRKGGLIRILMLQITG